jgi:tripartite-type tricarboxylate transporter receptor subunit TctC
MVPWFLRETVAWTPTKEAYMRLPIALVVAAAFAALTIKSAPAETWPSRPLTMLYPFTAGSAGDGVGRILASTLSDLLGQPVIFENAGGAGGMTGANRIAKASPDGYEFMLGGTFMVLNETIYRHPLYDAVKDFAPVALLAEQPTVLIARKDLPVNGLQEFISYARSNQAKMQYGSAGIGSLTHLSCALLDTAIGVNVIHVPYRGGGEALQDLMAGRIDYQCPILPVALPPIQSQTVKAIAVLGKERSPVLPDLQSAQEQGLADFDVTNWYAFFLPKGTPAPIVQKLHDATVMALKSPAVRERLNAIGATIVAPQRQSPAYLLDFVTSEIAKWAGPIKASGAQID